MCRAPGARMYAACSVSCRWQRMKLFLNDRWPDLKTKSCYTVLESLAYSLVFSAWCVFSPFHTQTTPTSSSLPLHPVDAPNKATCVVSGCLGERSPRQAACLCLSRNRLSPRCSALFSFFSFPRFAIRASASHTPLVSPTHSQQLLLILHVFLSLLLFIAFILFLFVISFSTTSSSNKHKTSSFTHSLSHWLHANLSFQNLPDVIHKAFLRSKPHWQGM